MFTHRPPEPRDAFNTLLAERTHPEKWLNPEPHGTYHLVVIGAGTTGLVTAAGAASVGARVALIERHLMGGDCLNYGCVPSKALIHSANSRTTDFEASMSRMRKLRAEISKHDSAERFQGLGVDVYLGEASFTSPQTVTVGDKELRFHRAVIATGARAAVPDIPGLKDTPYLTNETVFSLTELPSRLAVIGAGPIGCELAQAFRRFGSEVWLLQKPSQILSKEDREAAAVVQAQLESDGIQIVTGVQISSVNSEEGIRVRYSQNGSSIREIQVDQLLVSAGRKSNTESLALEKAGIQIGAHGIEINDFFQTRQLHIYAAGDVAMDWKFTHAADFAARAVIQNALFSGRKRLSQFVLPWATYTDPELAHIGLNSEQAEKQGIPVDVYRQDFSSVDRAITDGDTRGFVKVLTGKGKSRILGATIVGAQAGELISQLSIAMNKKIGLGSIASVIYPYPTRAEAVRKLGDQFNRTKLTPFTAGLLRGWLRLRFGASDRG